MPIPEAHDLTRRMLKHLENDTLDIADGVWREPRESFVEPDRLAADIAMIRRSPQVVGWLGEVREPRSYVTKDVMGVPVLITRDKDGELRAFVNACAHRGAAVAADCGTARMFKCGYHGWTYGLDGRLTGAPARKMFDGADLGNRALTELPVAVQAGLIVVGLSPDVALDGALGELEETFAQYDYAGVHHFKTHKFELSTNWKLAMNVNFEGYHFPITHENTLNNVATNNSPADTFGRHCRWAFPARNVPKLANVSEADWPDQVAGGIIYGLFPHTVIIESPGSSQMLRTYPGRRPGECIQYLSYGVYNSAPSEEELIYYQLAFDTSVTVLSTEDFPLATSCQRGLEGGLPEVIYGRNEPLLQHWASVWQRGLTVGAELDSPTVTLT